MDSYSKILRTKLVKKNTREVVEHLFNKESKVCIQLSSIIHQESRDEIRQSPKKNWRKITFLNVMINVHNRGPKHLEQKEEREKFHQRDKPTRRATLSVTSLQSFFQRCYVPPLFSPTIQEA